MSKSVLPWLALAFLALALAACQPGSGTAGSTTGSAPTSTPHSAPINVPPDYQGLVVVTFTPSTTYAQAVAVIESAGMKPQAPCPNPGPIRPGTTPTPPDQRDTFAESHSLTAVGVPALTQKMLHQVASSPQVTAVDTAPMVECPLIP